MQSLIDAIDATSVWDRPETRKNYPDVFGKYKNRHETACIDEIHAAEDPAVLAKDLMNSLEQTWKKTSIFTRSGEQESCRIGCVMFFLPMLLDTGDPACASFVEAFRSDWSERYPKQAFSAVPSETIARGFRKSFFSLDFFKKDRS